jgi:hypothetical protein
MTLTCPAAGEHLHHHLAFIEAQQAVVHEHTGQLVADRLVQQRRHHGRINTAGQAEDHLVAAHLGADLLDGLIHVVGHVPVVLAAADLVHEAGNHLLALDGVGDFRVELHRVELARLVGHGGQRGGLVGGDHLEARRQLGDLVTVAHPHIQQAVAFVIGPVLDVAEQLGMAPGADLGVAELPLAGALHLATQLGRHGLHAVADAKHRHPDLEHRHRRLHLARLVHRVGAAGQDDPLGRKAADELIRHIVGMDFAVHLLLTHTAGDELGDLGAEIEDQDFLVHGGVRRVKTGRPAL